MKKIVVGILDSGICADHPLICDDHIIAVGMCGSVNTEDTYGHGTAIYGIIRNVYNAVSNVEIINFKLPGVEHGIHEETLISALEEIADNFHIDILNVSMGISFCTQYDRLYQACQKLHERGVILVSAFNNDGSMSFPAAFDNCIGVSSIRDCHRKDSYIFVKGSEVDLLTFGGLQRLAWVNPKYIFMEGNSFACAHATNIVVNIFNQGYTTLDAVKARLSESATKCYDFSKCLTPNNGHCFKRNDLNSIKKAAIVPLSKELQTLLRNEDLLEFEITHVYDHRFSGRVNGKLSGIIPGYSGRLSIVESLDDITWGDFDTLIIGHMRELSAASGRKDILSTLIEEAVQHGKQVFSFDNLSDKYLDCPQIQFPAIYQYDAPPYRQGKMFRITKPVLGVFGTSSKQGKFSLQLAIRRCLKNMGYTVGQIGTEPQSLLFGFDYVFPMGYDGTVFIDSTQYVPFLNNAEHELSKTDIDLIIVGSQSGTIPYDSGNMDRIGVNQYPFILGCQPDAMVLCVNLYDDTSYILRTYNYLQAATGGKIIGIVVFPMTRESGLLGGYGEMRAVSEEELSVFSDKLKAVIDCNVYLLGKEMDILCNEIIDYFAEG